MRYYECSHIWISKALTLLGIFILPNKLTFFFFKYYISFLKVVFYTLASQRCMREESKHQIYIAMYRYKQFFPGLEPYQFSTSVRIDPPSLQDPLQSLSSKGVLRQYTDTGVPATVKTHRQEKDILAKKWCLGLTDVFLQVFFIFFLFSSFAFN